MQVISSTEARNNFFQVLKQNLENHEPLLIKGKAGDNVMIPATDWESIQETLYLTSIPGMLESIEEGRNTPLEECTTEIEWD